MKNKQYYALTESWLQNPADQTTIDELQKKFNDEVIEKFILFFFNDNILQSTLVIARARI